MTDTIKVAGVDRCFVNCESEIYIKTILGSAYMRYKLDIGLKQTFIHESENLLRQQLTIRAQSQPISNIVFYNPPNIITSLLDPLQLYNLLEDIKVIFADQCRLTFYTDGSLTNLNTEEVAMSIG